MISIHALQAESDVRRNIYTPLIRHISIHALQAESDSTSYQNITVDIISIHALQAESDLFQRLPCMHSYYFNPRSPSGERHTHLLKDTDKFLFQSTLSKRRATANNMHFLPELSLKSHNCCEILDKRNNLY